MPDAPPPPSVKLGVYCINDETEIYMMPLSHGLFPFLLILFFISFRFPLLRLHVFFPYFDWTYIFMPFSLLSFLHVSLAILT